MTLVTPPGVTPPVPPPAPPATPAHPPTHVAIRSRPTHRPARADAGPAAAPQQVAPFPPEAAIPPTVRSRPATSLLRPRSRSRSELRPAALALAVLLAACGGDSTDDGAPADAATPASTAAAAVATTAPPVSGAADAIESLPVAPALPAVPTPGPEPVSLTVDSLGVDSVVRSVGVEADGEMEVPPADEVGWYRFGARPGEPGGAVLAAHIAYDGVDGVFRHLADLAPGATIGVAFADGATRRFVVTEVARYPKSELPAEMWAPTGDPRLALVTCGGEFDSAADSYEDNVVAWATPA